MPAGTNFVGASIDSAAATYTETWSVPVVESPSPSRTLHGTTGGVAVGALQSGSGTATLVFALNPAGGVAAADVVTVDIAADSVRNSSSGTPNSAVAGAAVTNKSGLSLPGQATGLAARADTARVTLTWSAVAGAASYNVYRSDTVTGANPATGGVLIGAASSPSYSDPTGSGTRRYEYSVAAVNSLGEGTKSAGVTAGKEAPLGRVERVERTGRTGR